MKLNLLSDTNWESKVDHAIKVVDTVVMADMDYGPALSALIIVLNCQEPELGHKQRVRLTKVTNSLYVDVMLDLRFFVRATHAERRREIFEQVISQVREVLEKRRLKGFDFERFLADLDKFLDDQLNGANSTRLDDFCLERASGF